MTNMLGKSTNVSDEVARSVTRSHVYVTHFYSLTYLLPTTIVHPCTVYNHAARPTNITYT